MAREGYTDSDLLRRCVDFAFALDREAAELTVPAEAGEFIVNRSAPLLWDASYLAVEDRGRTAEELARIASEGLVEHGFSEPMVAPLDPAEGQRLEPGFRDLGWKLERGLYMAFRRAPDRPANHEVEEVEPAETFELRRRVMQETWASDYTGDPDEIGDQLLDRDRAYAEAGGDRWFIAREDGAVAACCALFSRDGVGQVETVLAEAAARNRGYARAVVLAAVEASKSDGNELTFIAAEADDWPWRLYERLGFDPVGELVEFVDRAAGR